MKNRWKRLAVIFGAAMLIVCQNGVIQVRAEEAPETEKTELKEDVSEMEETDSKKEIQEEETEPKKETEEKTEPKKETEEKTEPKKETEEEEENELQEETLETEKNVLQKKAPLLKAAALQEDAQEEVGKQNAQKQAPVERAAKLDKVTDLKWNNKGQGVFTNPNDKSFFVIEVKKDDGTTQRFNEFGKAWGKGTVTVDLYHLLENGGSGEYTFRVQSVCDGFDASEITDWSAGFTYTAPSTQLPTPSVSVSGGVVSVTALNGYTLVDDYGIEYHLCYRDNSGRYQYLKQYGCNDLSFDAGSAWGGLMTPGRAYYIMVRGLSRDVSKYKTSEYSSPVLIADYTSKSSSGSKSKSSKDKEPEAQEEQEEEIIDYSVFFQAPEVEPWKPETPDEIKRYAAVGKENPVITADAGNAYSVVIYNAMQGKQCFDSFEAVLEDWIIGRTYNILPSNGYTYKMDSKAKFTLNIPQSLQASGRQFKMICVSEKGRPVILNDLDSNAGTITFETDTYYAFALVYKDTVQK